MFVTAEQSTREGVTRDEHYIRLKRHCANMSGNFSQPFVSRRLGQQNANFVQRANQIARSDQRQLDKQASTAQQAQELLDRTNDLTLNVPRFQERASPSKFSRFLDHLKFWKHLPDFNLNRTDDTPLFTPRTKRIIAYAAGIIVIVCLVIFISYVLAQAKPPKPKVIDVHVSRNSTSNVTHDKLINQLETDMSEKLRDLSSKVARVHERETALKLKIQTTEQHLGNLIDRSTSKTHSENVNPIDWSSLTNDEQELANRTIDLSQRIEKKVRSRLAEHATINAAE